MKVKKEAVFVTQWKQEMTQLIKMKFSGYKLSNKKINLYMDKLIQAHMVNPQLEVVNNYRDAVVKTDLLSLIDTIEEKQLIIGGGGVLYVQHGDGKENVMYDYITTQQGLRGSYKAKRKDYPDHSDEWIYYDILQNATKIIINSLYGVHGYDGFILYNRFIAESVTNIGRQIITTALLTFENFLSNGVKYNTENEVYKFILNIVGEYDEKIDYSIFQIPNIDQEVIKKILNICAFEPSEAFIQSLEDMVQPLNHGQKVLLYYKNNLYEFSKLPFIRDKYIYIINTLDELKAPNIKLMNDDLAKVYIQEIWEFYEKFVVYDYPIYDRVRKAMYTDHSSVLYGDTDSTFLGLNQWITFVKVDFLQNQFNKPESEVDFIIVNLMAMILTNVIKKELMTFCKHMNTKEEHAKRLDMKNEFYISRIMFTDAKKRYISNTILQEGKLLNNGIGVPDIKGFDFKKAQTKPFLKDIYTHICEEDILRAKEIDVVRIYQKIMDLKKQIEENIQSGENKFYKQATVQIVDHYAEPYSTQGIVAVSLWNCLNPEYAMELPTDCDIVPIKEITGPKINDKGKQSWPNRKIVEGFQERFPEAYAKLEKEIYNNPNKLIRNMGLTSIAKPKNTEIPIPEWFMYLINEDKIVLDSLNLISPVLHSLGLKGLKTNAMTEYVSTIVDL